MSGHGCERRAGQSAVDEPLNVAVGAIGRNGEARDAVGIANRAVVDAAKSAAGCGIERDLSVLHHEAASQFQLFDEADGRGATVDMQLTSTDRDPAVGIGDTPQRGLDRKSTRLNSSHLGISYAA